MMVTFENKTVILYKNRNDVFLEFNRRMLGNLGFLASQYALVGFSYVKFNYMGRRGEEEAFNYMGRRL